MSDEEHRPLVDGLRRLARSARTLVARTAATAAAAGRETARRITPDPAADQRRAPPGGPLVARLGALGGRLAELEAAVAGRAEGPADRVRAGAALLLETGRLLAAAGDACGDEPTLADPGHPAAGAVRRLVRELERDPAPTRELRRALAALTHPLRAVRLEALDHLGEPLDERVLPVLQAAARAADTDATERRAIMACVRRAGDAAVDSPVVAAALSDADPAVRLHGVQVQARHGAAAVVLEALAATDPSPAVRRSSVGAVLQGETARCSARLVPALRDPDRRVRLEAVATAGASAGAAAALPLMRGLLDPDPAVQAAAAAALERLGVDLAGLPPASDAAARRAAVTELRRQWGRERFAALGASGARDAVAGEGELADPLAAEFLVDARGSGGGGDDRDR